MIMEARNEINGEQKMEEIMLPGFRFHPTDEELVGFYLKRKIQERPIAIELIKPLDIYKHDPWDLPKLATTGEKEWYFYCRRDRKYRNSTRPNRVTGAGFWKATGTDRPIYSSNGSKCIGLKKSLVFYRGRAAKGFKTDWMMHEFRLPSNGDRIKQSLEKTIPPNELWAICRIFKKASSSSHKALSHSWESPILPKTPSPSNINPTPPTLTTNNQAPQISSYPFWVHEPAIDSSSLLYNMPPYIFGAESLDCMINKEQQDFSDGCLLFDSIPEEMQEKLVYGDQDQECTIDMMLTSATDVMYFNDQWDFSNTNNCYI